MPALVSLNDGIVLTTVRSVLLDLLPAGVDVIRGYGNRVPEPFGPDFCVISALRRERLSTNRDSNIDIKLTGGIVGDTLTVETGGPLRAGYALYGLAVAPGTAVTAALPSPWQQGSYTVTPAQDVPAGSKIYAGRHAMLQPADLVFQCDVHGPNANSNATAISVTWRDETGCQLFADKSGALDMQPLYAEDPRMMAFQNAESQWEDRWIIDLHLQANVVVTVGQEFADEVLIRMFPVDLFIVP